MKENYNDDDDYSDNDNNEKTNSSDSSRLNTPILLKVKVSRQRDVRGHPQIT